MPERSNRRPGVRDLLTLPLIPFAVIAALGLVLMLAVPGSRWSVLSALIVTGTSALAGGAVVAWVWRKWPDFLPQAILAAMGIRMLTTLIGILIFVLILENRELKFIIFTIVFYLAGLICETITAVSKLSMGNAHLSASREKES